MSTHLGFTDEKACGDETCMDRSQLEDSEQEAECDEKGAAYTK